MASLEDPNALTGVNPDPVLMQRNVAQAYDSLGRRVAKGEINEAERDRLIKGLLEDMANKIDAKTVKPKDAWRYADILRQSGRWVESHGLYVRAVELAKASDDTDRFVNDSLQLARVSAHLDKLPEAFELVRGTFSVGPKDKAPILMSTLYEIVPEAKGKGQDSELAELLMDAIDQHLATVVDPKLDTGKEFMGASPSHLARAWSEVFSLLRSAGRDDLFKAAVERQERQASTTGSF